MATTTQKAPTKSVLDEVVAQQGQWAMIVSEVIDESIQLFDLNSKAAKNNVDLLSSSSKRLLSARTPQELFSPDPDFIQKKMNQMIAYGTELSKITADFQAIFTQALQSQVHNNIGAAARLAAQSDSPARANAVSPVNFMQAAMDNMQKGFQQWAVATTKSS